MKTSGFRLRLRGFTLIEMVITVAIVALLASVALPLAEVTSQRSREQDLRRSLREVREAIDAYKRAADDGVIERKADASGYPPTLAALVQGVPDKRNPEAPKIFFLRRLPRDPMAREDGDGWGLRSYASTAAEPKEGDDVYDVYSKSEAKGLNGVPYKDW
jgi:general secretion pathway protein G